MMEDDDQEKNEQTLVPLDTDQEKEKQAIASLPEIHGPREHLTPAQRTVLAALGAGYSVCTSRHSGLAAHEAVLLGNGSRLTAITVDSLEWRGLIEVASVEREPPRRPDYPDHWRKELLFFRLTERGRLTVIRQHLSFDAREVSLPLPSRVSKLQEAIERYRATVGCEPEVAIRGTISVERLGWCTALTDWHRVLAYNEAENLLGLVGGVQGDDEDTLLWVRPNTNRWSQTSPVRVRLRPARPEEAERAANQKALPGKEIES